MLRGLLRWGREGSEEHAGVFCRVGSSLRGMGSEITYTQCPLPLTDIPCQTSRVRNLIAILLRGELE